MENINTEKNGDSFLIGKIRKGSIHVDLGKVMDAIENAWHERQSLVELESDSNHLSHFEPILRADGKAKLMSAYFDLHVSLQATNDGQIAGELKDLKSDLAKAMNNGNFSEVDNYFDKRTENTKNELNHIAEINKSKTSYIIAAKINDFGKSISSAINQLLGTDKGKQ